MGHALFDRTTARTTLVDRGLSTLAADDFLMKSLLTATEAATVLGVKDSRAARDTLRRWGVKPISRGPGRNGENAYPAELVWQYHQNRPGRGWRKTRSTTEEPTSRGTPPAESEPWYANHDDVVALAAILVEANWLSTPSDVVGFFSTPWKWAKQWMIWATAGQPLPPSPDDLAQARTLAPGPLRAELERRHQDDTARWAEFVTALDELDTNDPPVAEQNTAAGHGALNVLPFPKRSGK